MPPHSGPSAQRIFFRIQKSGTHRDLPLPAPLLYGAAVLLPLLLAVAAAGACWSIYRDEALASLLQRQNDMRLGYEDKLASLRLQVERAVSRQLLDQNTIEGRVHELLSRQAQLESRASLLVSLADQMGVSHALTPASIPSAMPPSLTAEPPAISEPAAPQKPRPDGIELRTQLQGREPMRSLMENADLPVPQRLQALGRRLDHLDQDQVTLVSRVGTAARHEAQRLRQALTETGLAQDKLNAPPSGVGGPFVPLKADPAGPMFERALDRIAMDLSSAMRLAHTVRQLPLKRPLAGGDISSSFGTRIDPFYRRAAFHAGLDLRDEPGASVRATAAGTVVTAGWSGGYGNLIEIEHANGVSTRYGHLSAMSVREGQIVEAGAVIGRVGSTGRSTGPHLHYEVRIDDEPVDPLRFLKAGARLAAR